MIDPEAVRKAGRDLRHGHVLQRASLQLSAMAALSAMPEAADTIIAVIAPHARSLAEPWQPDTTYHAGMVLEYEGSYYLTVQPEIVSQAHQPPGSPGMLAVYRPMQNPESGADGSTDRPYEYVYGMDVDSGMYYTFEGKLYLAKADMKPCVWYPGAAGVWQWELQGG